MWCAIAIILWVLGGLYIAAEAEPWVCDWQKSRNWQRAKLTLVFIFWPLIVIVGGACVLFCIRMEDIFRGGMSA